jgi:hypothetical protein
VAVAGALAELAAVRAMEDGLGEVGRVYGEGSAGRLGSWSRGLTTAGAAVLALAGRRRAGGVVGGLLLAVGGALLRFAVMEAGRQSAADPAFVVGPQRDRGGGRRA